MHAINNAAWQWQHRRKPRTLQRKHPQLPVYVEQQERSGGRQDPDNSKRAQNGQQTWCSRSCKKRLPCRRQTMIRPQLDTRTQRTHRRVATHAIDGNATRQQKQFHMVLKSYRICAVEYGSNQAEHCRNHRCSDIHCSCGRVAAAAETARQGCSSCDTAW